MKVFEIFIANACIPIILDGFAILNETYDEWNENEDDYDFHSQAHKAIESAVSKLSKADTGLMFSGNSDHLIAIKRAMTESYDFTSEPAEIALIKYLDSLLKLAPSKNLNLIESLF